MSYLTALDTRIRRLHTQQARAAAFVPGQDWYQLSVAPSCPPDTRIHLRGGLAYCGNFGAAYLTWNNRTYTVPNLTAELTDPDSVSVEIVFSNAGWYKFAMLLLALPALAVEPAESDWGFYLFETGEELQTATEAEAWMTSVDFRQAGVWSGETGYPLCGVVLRNDGQAGVPGAILPVDVVNRGRSYLWPRDVRPRKYFHY